MFGSDFEVGPKSKALVLKLATTSSSFFPDFGTTS